MKPIVIAIDGSDAEEAVREAQLSLSRHGLRVATAAWAGMAAPVEHWAQPAAIRDTDVLLILRSPLDFWSAGETAISERYAESWRRAQAFADLHIVAGGQDHSDRLKRSGLRAALGNRLAVFTGAAEAAVWARDMVERLRTHLDIHLTNICPLRCESCAFAAGAGYRMDDAVRAGRTAQRIIDVAMDAGISEFHLLGGEPLALGAELLELLRHIRSRGGRTHLITSAYTLRLADEILEAIGPAGAVFVSLDGDRDTHNRRRGMAVFDSAMSFLERAARAGVPIRVGTVVDRVNVASAARVVGALAERGIRPRSLCFMNMSPTGGLFSGGKSSPMANYLSAGEWIAFTNSLLRDERLAAAPWIKIEPAFSRHPALFGCELLQGRRRIVVMSSGDVYECFMLTPLPPAGNILRDSPDTVLRALAQRRSLPEGAQDCAGCLGGCPGYAALWSNGRCDARCPGSANSSLPGQLSPEHLAQGYRPICPCRTISLPDLARWEHSLEEPHGKDAAGAAGNGS